MSRKVAFVTNAKEYAGAPAVAALVKAGWEVFCSDDSFTSPESRAAYERETPGRHAASARDAAGFIAEGLDRFGRIDALISNDIPKGLANKAGQMTAAEFNEITDLMANFEAYLDSLVPEPVRLLRAALPAMKA